MSRVHRLKTLPEYMYRVHSGQKTFEVRRNDRDFQVGDILALEIHYPPDHHDRESRNNFGGTVWQINAKVTYVLPGGQFGIEPGYCIMGIEKVEL